MHCNAQALMLLPAFNQSLIAQMKSKDDLTEILARVGLPSFFCKLILPLFHTKQGLENNTSFSRKKLKIFFHKLKELIDI